MEKKEKMKAMIILGSQNPEGQTASATQALIQGITEADGQCEQVFLPQMDIERCRQCEYDGWGICKTEGQCIIEDDFALVVDKIREADAAVFATPVYFGDLSESMRAFLDRLRRIYQHSAGQDGITAKIAVGICVAGGRGGGGPTCTVSLEKILRQCDFDVVDLIPARRQNLDMKMDILKITGQWLTSLPASD